MIYRRFSYLVRPKIMSDMEKAHTDAFAARPARKSKKCIIIAAVTVLVVAAGPGARRDGAGDRRGADSFVHGGTANLELENGVA